jgi:citron Rho-interacting kinase
MPDMEEAQINSTLDNPRKFDNFDPKGYKKLVKNIGGLKDSIEAEREAVEARIAKLEEDKIKAAETQKTVQVALGKQVTAFNRGYQNILAEFQHISRQYKILEEEKVREAEAGEEKRKELVLELHQVREEREEAVKIREAQIVEIKAGIPALHVKIEEQQVLIGELKEAHTKEVQNWNALLLDARKHEEELMAELEVERKKYVDRELEMKDQLREQEEVKALALAAKLKAEHKIAELIEEVAVEKAAKEKLIYEKENDKTAEIVKRQCEEDFREFLKLKDEGYQKLMHDFVAMQDATVKQISGMREESAAHIERLDGQLRAKVDELDRVRSSLTERLQKKEDEISKLLVKIVQLQDAALEKEIENSGGGEAGREIKALKIALQEQADENIALKEEIARMGESDNSELKNYQMKIRALENNLKTLSDVCDKKLAVKDEEVKKAMAGIHAMQNEVDAERLRSEMREKEWEERVRVKEEAYDLLLGNISLLERKIKRLEEYAEEIWGKVRKKESEMVAQAMRYEARLEEKRREYERVLEEKNLILEEVDEAKRVTEEQKKVYEKVIEDLRAEFVDVEKQLRVEIAELNSTIKEKQREIFALMEEMERKEKEWKAKEQELLATIKEREREIDQLKTEMKFRIEQLQAEIDELQESYDALKRKYDADLTGDNSVASLKASLDRLQKQLRDMQSRLEALMGKIKELRQTIREKDFEIEDTKRVCMDIVQQKEAAYQALLEDMNKIRDDYDAYKKMLQQKFFEMGQEFKKQKTTYESTIHNLEEELERERAVHVIVAELKAEIEKWKKKHQEEIDYR